MTKNTVATVIKMAVFFVMFFISQVYASPLSTLNNRDTIENITVRYNNNMNDIQLKLSTYFMISLGNNYDGAYGPGISRYCSITNEPPFQIYTLFFSNDDKMPYGVEIFFPMYKGRLLGSEVEINHKDIYQVYMSMIKAIAPYENDYTNISQAVIKTINEQKGNWVPLYIKSENKKYMLRYRKQLISVNDYHRARDHHIIEIRTNFN